MHIDSLISSLIYLIAVFAIFVFAKVIYGLINRDINITEELLKKDNFAFAITLTGYYLGIVIAIGGSIVGPSLGMIDDLIDIFMYGIFAIVMMNIAIFINDKVILRRFSSKKEIITDRNEGVGVVEFGNCVAIGLVIYGSVSGEGGNMLTALGCVGLGLIALIAAELVYNFILPYDLLEHLEKDNVAVGISFAGVLIGMGNIIRNAVGSDFISWEDTLTNFGIYVIFGLVLLPFIRLLTDKVLLHGEKLTKELIGQEKPNLGAALIEAFSYIASSFLIGWCM
jgi:uncharacterized membrane protein YjfL (UPF0719 family)